MVQIHPSSEILQSPSAANLLYPGEIIVIVDDSPEIALLLKTYLAQQSLPLETAENAEQFYELFAENQVALVFLDIGLPGKSGTEILSEIAPNHPDLGIIMVTGTTDIQMALDCLRNGADDYLTKPLMAEEFNHTLYQTLKKRRLVIENRQFQKQLESSNFRMEFLHSLNLKMNSAYLNALELNSVLQTILAGITSEDGLKFNRAFLALFDEDGENLIGQYGVGPSSREEANHLWQDIKHNNMGLHAILDHIVEKGGPADTPVNRLAQSLYVDGSHERHILIQASRRRESIHVRNGYAKGVEIPEELITMLDENTFVVVPLFSPSRSLGVIIADNFVTGNEISDDDIAALEIFANQASLAIEHSHLYRDMNDKIEELKLVTRELEQNKDMLLETERYSTIGYISAKLVHAIRNPLTSIGGTARLLLKRLEEAQHRQYLEIVIQETSKIEDTLTNIFEVADEIVLQPEPTHVGALLKESLALFYTEFQKCAIEVELDINGDNTILNLDAKKIRKVLNQLIRTSIDAIESHGKLVVSFFRHDDETTLTLTASSSREISTTGGREDLSYTTRTYGSGLGLAVVEQILDLHDAVFTIRQLSANCLQISITFPLQSL